MHVTIRVSRIQMSTRDNTNTNTNTNTKYTCDTDNEQKHWQRYATAPPLTCRGTLSRPGSTAPSVPRRPDTSYTDTSHAISPATPRHTATSACSRSIASPRSDTFRKYVSSSGHEQRDTVRPAKRREHSNGTKPTRLQSKQATHYPQVRTN